MHPTQIVQGSINIFISLCVIVAFAQDIWFNPSLNSTPSSNQSPSTIQNNSTTPQNVTETPEIAGITIFATPKLHAEVKEMLNRENYNVRIEDYKFEGQEWWFTAIIDYGHIFVVYYLMSKYQTSNDANSKRKILIIGALLLCLWFAVLPSLKPSKISIQIEGSQVYNNEEVVAAQIIPVIADHSDFQAFDDVQI